MLPRYRGPGQSAGRQQDAPWGETPHGDIRSHRGLPSVGLLLILVPSRPTNPDMRSISKKNAGTPGFNAEGRFLEGSTLRTGGINLTV